MGISTLYASTGTISTTEFSLPFYADYVSTSRVGTAAVMQTFIDTSAMTAGKQLQIRIYERVTSSSPQLVIYEAILSGTMAATWVSPSLVMSNGWDVTCKVVSSSVALNWSIRAVS